MDNKTLTIMFADMAGFTSRTSSQSRAANINLINKLRELLVPIIDLHKGVIIKTIGDAILCTFESPTNAVLAGMHLQRILKRYNSKIEPSNQIKVRVALNSGEVTLQSGDIFGDAVNIASRIEGVAEAEDVVFSESTYLAMNKSEVQVEDLGPHELSGVPYKVRLYRVLKDGQTAKPSSSTVPASPEKSVEAKPTYPVRTATLYRRVLARCVDLFVALCACVFLFPKIDLVKAKEVQTFWENVIALPTRVETAVERQTAEVTGITIPKSQALKDRVSLRSRLNSLSSSAREIMDHAKFGPLVLLGLIALFACTIELLSNMILRRTFGKILFSLHIFDSNGSKASITQRALRAALLVLSFVTCGIGFMVAITNGQRRTLHDYLSGTRIVSRG